MSLFDTVQNINIRLRSSNLGKQIIEKWEILKKDKDAEYFVRRHINQFMGVISINDLNNRQLMGPFAPGFLNEEIYNLFLHSHLQLVQMNKRCLASVENIIPGFFNLVTFYDGITPEVDKKFSFEEMFTSQELDELSKLIANTEPIKNLVALLPQFKGQDTTNWKMPFGIFLQKIGFAGAMKSPSEITGLNFTGPGKTQAETVMKIAFSSIVLRMIYMVINQLIFQSLIYGDLITLDSNTVIEIKNVSHGVGEGFEALCVCSNMEMMLCEPGRIVRIVIPERHIETLAYLDGTQMEHSEETGTLKKMTMRRINSDLNPFSNLLR